MRSKIFHLVGGIIIYTIAVLFLAVAIGVFE